MTHNNLKSNGDVSLNEQALAKHSEWRGKYEIMLRAPLDNEHDLSLAYTPGVAEPCKEIRDNPEKSFEYTRRWNTVAVITDGTAVLGLGDIGPLAAMPVMEGKAALFKKFGDVDAIPLCLATKDIDEIVNTIVLLEGSFGGINLEDISAPRCFEIERKLKERLSIPVFHDDQQGTAIVTLAAVKNAVKLTGKTPAETKIVINGAGAAGTAIVHLLRAEGFNDIIVCNSKGVIYRGKEGLNHATAELAEITNDRLIKGTLADAMLGSDMFIGVSVPNCVTADMIRSMNAKPVIFAMSNPVPEIMPDIAKEAGAFIVGTGRSDFPNQINNVLAFPGIFRGALDARAPEITIEMALAAAEAIANCVSDVSPGCIIPKALDKQVAEAVAKAVYNCK
ncbi:MAG: NADP-dependent malic enzyme [Defluviitaleaceae bacterium]|nr:NADP-dependent malic enzyme [Defluviitaleaceae bacterium]